MQQKQQKAQGAIELLMTYAWVLVAIVVAGGAILVLASVTPPSACSGFSKLVYKDHAADSAGNFDLVLINGEGQDINIESIIFEGDFNGRGRANPVLVAAGGTFAISGNVGALQEGSDYRGAVVIKYSKGGVPKTERGNCRGNAAKGVSTISSFADGSKAKVLRFDKVGRETLYLALPKNAKILDAALNLGCTEPAQLSEYTQGEALELKAQPVDCVHIAPDDEHVEYVNMFSGEEYTTYITVYSVCQNDNNFFVYPTLANHPIDELFEYSVSDNNFLLRNGENKKVWVHITPKAKTPRGNYTIYLNGCLFGGSELLPLRQPGSDIICRYTNLSVNLVSEVPPQIVYCGGASGAPKDINMLYGRQYTTYVRVFNTTSSPDQVCADRNFFISLKFYCTSIPPDPTGNPYLNTPDLCYKDISNHFDYSFSDNNFLLHNGENRKVWVYITPKVATGRYTLGLMGGFSVTRLNVTMVDERCPASISLDVGGDVTLEWNGTGNEMHTVNLADYISNYLEACTADAEGNCTIPLVLRAGSAGKIEVSGINVKYVRK